MSFKEKSTWIMVIITTGAYAAYVSNILGRAGGNTPLDQVPYASTLLGSAFKILAYRRGFQQW